MASGCTLTRRDPQNDTKYYQWKYEESWEIHSTCNNKLMYFIDPVTTIPTAVAYKYPDKSDDTTIYKCWNTLNSSAIILGSTEKLTSDVVYLPVQYIEPHSEKLSVLYSINLRQYAISKDDYLFLQKMKKNTEQLGTPFDPQPSEISGNIHCLTDPNETVIGYVEITQEQLKRIFISNSQVPDWNYDPDCVFIEVANNRDSIAKYGVDLMPTLVSKENPFIGNHFIFCSAAALRRLHVERGASKTRFLAINSHDRKLIFYKMQNLIKKTFILAVYSLIAVHLCGQQNLSDIQTAFSKYNNSSLTEKVFAHTDKNFYLAGENRLVQTICGKWR
jgi:hypothetical protein